MFVSDPSRVAEKVWCSRFHEFLRYLQSYDVRLVGHRSSSVLSIELFVVEVREGTSVLLLPDFVGAYLLESKPIFCASSGHSVACSFE